MIVALCHNGHIFTVTKTSHAEEEICLVYNQSRGPWYNTKCNDTYYAQFTSEFVALKSYLSTLATNSENFTC